MNKVTNKLKRALSNGVDGSIQMPPAKRLNKIPVHVTETIFIDGTSEINLEEIIELKPQGIRIRRDFNKEEKEFLEKEFRKNQYPDRKGYVAISKFMKISSQRVRIWFCNRRQKEATEAKKNYNQSRCTHTNREKRKVCAKYWI